jgi:hypothetical protein
VKYIKMVSVISLTALVGVGAIFAWSRAHRQAPATSEQPVPPPPSTSRESGPQLLLLPPEPQAPEKGTAGRRIYLGAMIAGEERGLATVRKALSDSQARVPKGNGASDEPRTGSEPTAGAQAIRRLRLLEQTYTERLERHRLELAAEP